MRIVLTNDDGIEAPGSQMATRQSYVRVYDPLKAVYLSWEAILDLPLDEVLMASRLLSGRG